MPLAVTPYTQTVARLELSMGYVFGLGPGANQFITKLEGWHDPPAVRRPKTARLNTHGNFSEAGTREERLITVQGIHSAADRSGAARQTDALAAFLADGAEGVFTVDDVDLGSRYCRVRLDGKPDVKWNGGTDVRFTIDLAAADPRKYGAAVQHVTYPPVDGGGLVFPLFTGTNAGVLDYGEPGSSGIVTVANEGSADSLPTFRVEGYAPGFTITELTTGRRLVYTGTVPKGSTLVLDPFQGTAMLDGSNRGLSLPVREWTAVPPYGAARYLFECAAPSARLTIEGAGAWW